MCAGSGSDSNSNPSTVGSNPHGSDPRPRVSFVVVVTSEDGRSKYKAWPPGSGSDRFQTWTDVRSEPHVLLPTSRLLKEFRKEITRLHNRCSNFRFYVVSKYCTARPCKKKGRIEQIRRRRYIRGLDIRCKLHSVGHPLDGSFWVNPLGTTTDVESGEPEKPTSGRFRSSGPED